MSFIKSYWWVFALLIGAFLIYWFMFRKTTSTTPKTKANPACALSVEQWDAKVAEVAATIATNPTWLAAVEAKVANGEYSNIETAKLASAANYVEFDLKICNPTRAVA